MSSRGIGVRSITCERDIKTVYQHVCAKRMHVPFMTYCEMCECRSNARSVHVTVRVVLPVIFCRFLSVCNDVYSSADFLRTSTLALNSKWLAELVCDRSLHAQLCRHRPPMLSLSNIHPSSVRATVLASAVWLVMHL